LYSGKSKNTPAYNLVAAAKSVVFFMFLNCGVRCKPSDMHSGVSFYTLVDGQAGQH